MDSDRAALATLSARIRVRVILASGAGCALGRYDSLFDAKRATPNHAGVQAEKAKGFVRYWAKNLALSLRKAKDVYAMTAFALLILVAIAWCSWSLDLKQFPLAQLAAKYAPTFGAVILFSVFILWLPFRRHEEQKSAHGLEKQTLQNEIQKFEAQILAQNSFKISPKKFTPAFDLNFFATGLNPGTMRPTVNKASLGVQPAFLKVIFYNLTPVPIILDQIEVLNATTGELFQRIDAEARRVEVHGSAEMNLPLGSIDCQLREPPTWQAQIAIQTASDNRFVSTPFNFSALVQGTF